MFCVVAYDIPDDRRRDRLAKILEDYGDRYIRFKESLEQFSD